jgi:hypothetical protein
MKAVSAGFGSFAAAAGGEVAAAGDSWPLAGDDRVAITVNAISNPNAKRPKPLLVFIDSSLPLELDVAVVGPPPARIIQR